jgi:hypothetical protein
MDESTSSENSPFLIQPSIKTTAEESKNYIEIIPVYTFTVKTSLADVVTDKKELDINICTHESLAAPYMMTKLDAEGNPVEGLNIPVSIGGINESNGTIYHDVVFNPIILEDINADTTGKYRGNIIFYLCIYLFVFLFTSVCIYVCMYECMYV